MSLTLILMRHCKSSWDHAGPDHARPLNNRGRRAATDLAAWLKSEGHLPAEALVSSAARTRETFERLRCDGPVRYERALYLAEAHEMLSVLRTARETSVLMVGHNPGIAEFAEALLREPPDDGDFIRYPTGATSIIDFDADGWGNVIPGEGILRDFIVPRRLERPAG